MKNKLIIASLVLFTFISILPVVNSEARWVDKSQLGLVFIGNYSSGYAVFGHYYNNGLSYQATVNSNSITLNYSINRVSGNTVFATPSDAITWWNNYSGGDLPEVYQQTFSLFIYIKGNYVVVQNDTNKNYYQSLNAYEKSLEPKWYENVWDNFTDAIGATGSGIADFFSNLIDSIFGEDSEGGPISHAVTIRNPTIAPTPTPIPYSTVVIPKTDIVTGETVYETNYYYVNPSGTPIVTSSPPVNSPTSGGGGGSSTEYYPINGDPYSLPYLDWLNNVDIGDSNYDGIDSIGDGLSAVDDIGSEYSDGMSAVQDSTGTLPASWLLLIGIAAAIPLLAGIISRFLGG